MKKIYFSLMLGVFTLGLSAQNLVLNPGFEDWDNSTAPTSWTKAQNVEQEALAANVHSGTNSAKHTGGRSDLSQTFSVVGGKTYALSLWYKVEAGDGTDCRIWSNWVAGGTNLTDDEALLKGPDNGYFTGSADWQEYSITLTAPETATDFYFEVRTYSGAIIYWDDFSFEEVASAPAPLFFSEYIEGSGNNKALEIYNPNTEAVDLASYQIAQSNNGGGWAYYHIFPVGASIEPGDVWVLLNADTDPLLFDAANADEVLAYPSPVHHNGDDARAVIYVTATDTTYMDIIGTPDLDPGSGWDVAGVSAATANHTILRKEGTLVGTDDWALSAGTDADDSQWIVMESNYFSDLGNYGPDLDAPIVTFEPADGAMSVSASSGIYVRFDEKVQNADGTPITDASALVELKLDDATGVLVDVDVFFDVDGKYILIQPKAALLNSQVYYVALLAGVVEDEAGNTVEELQSASFTTIGPIEVTYPMGGEVFYPGEDVHIDWITDGITNNITIWVSFDNGLTFIPIVEDIDPAPGTVNYTIPVDSESSLEAVIRIAEATNTTFEATEPMDDSEPFAIVPMLSISEIQGTVEPNGNSSYADTVCLTTGVVSFANGKNEYYISAGSGNFSGVAVRDDVNKPVIGDSIVIAGTVEEYYSLTQISSLISYEFIESGKAVPAPVVVASGAASEELEGVMVTLKSAVVVTAPNSYGEAEVDDGSGVILTDDVYFAASLNLGGTYDITGPLSYSYNKWRVYPRTADDVVEIPSNVAGVTSEVYTVDNDAETITDVPALEELAVFVTNILPVYGATFEVYQADGTSIATDLQSGYKLIATSQDALVTKTYTITKSELSDNASVTSLVYTIDGDAGSITGVLFKASVATFEALLVPAAGASFATYQSDGTTLATDLQTGYKLIVTAEDDVTTKTYDITLDDAMPMDLIFSEYIEGSGNNKALEVFNPNDAAVRLDYYQLAQISNGGDSWEYFHIFPAGVVLESHATWVIITDETSADYFAAADADEVLGYPSVVHHNGDDARGLIIVTAEDTTLVDIIGEIGADPGDGWSVAGIANATKDHTLLRKGTVMTGNIDWASSAGNNELDSEWIVKDVNFFDSLGTHFLVMPEPSSDATLSALMVGGTSVVGFSPAQLTYYMTLPAGTTDAPVVTATTSDEFASVNIIDATDLSGDAAARTTSVEVTAEDGVTMKTYTIEFTVEVSVENDLFRNVRVFPVPASNLLYIDNASLIESITLFDISGAALLKVQNSTENQITLDISSLEGGVYVIRMESSEANTVRRFVKQ